MITAADDNGELKLTGSGPLGDFTLRDSSNQAVALASNTTGAQGLPAGTYSLTASGTGQTVQLSVASQSAAGWQNAIDATSLAGSVTASADGQGRLVLTGTSNLGTLQVSRNGVSVNNSSVVANTVSGLAAGSYGIYASATNQTTTINVASQTLQAWQNAIDATSLNGSITASLSGTGQLILTGANTLGDFTLLDQNGGAISLAANTAGVARANAGYFSSTSSGFRSMAEIDFSSDGGAALALRIADNAIDSLSGFRSGFGTAQNALMFAIDSGLVQEETTSVARSGIVDADYALESARLAKEQVLQESSSKMLSASLSNVQLVSKLIESL